MSETKTGTTLRDFGPIMRGLGSAALERVFCAEWIKLDSLGEKLVLQDFLEASEEDRISARDYHSRIGDGGLESYSKVMIARYQRGW